MKIHTQIQYGSTFKKKTISFYSKGEVVSIPISKKNANKLKLMGVSIEG